MSPTVLENCRNEPIYGKFPWVDVTKYPQYHIGYPEWNNYYLRCEDVACKRADLYPEDGHLSVMPWGISSHEWSTFYHHCPRQAMQGKLKYCLGEPAESHIDHWNNVCGDAN